MEPQTLPVPAAGKRRDDARYVRRNFWKKVRRTLGLVPFLEDAIAAWFCARDPQTPARVRAVLLGALAWFITPVDLIPDFVAGLGFTDDASVLLAAMTVVGRHITDRHRARARRALAREEDSRDTGDPGPASP